MNPLVSIIVPVYNMEAYLRRCLDSVYNQTYTNIEIICVNDGSTDHSLDILNEYASRDARFKVISTKNAGLGAARNVGLRLVSGTWVTGLDSDDYLDSDACSYAISQASDDVDIIQIGAISREVGKPDVFHRGRVDGKFSISAEILINQPCEFWGKFWRKSFLDMHDCKFPEGYWYEDWFFYWAYLPMARNVVYLPECKYIYERRPTSIMGLTQNKSPKILDHVWVLILLLNFRQERGLPKAFSCCNLVNFIQCASFVYKFASESTKEKAYDMLTLLSTHPLMAPWKKWLRFLKTSSKWSQLFIKRDPYMTCYGFLGVYPIKVNIYKNRVIFRLFGYRFWSYDLFRDYKIIR